MEEKSNVYNVILVFKKKETLSFVTKYMNL